MKNSIFADEHDRFDYGFLARDFFGISDTHSQNLTYPVLNIYTFRPSMFLKTFSMVFYCSSSFTKWEALAVCKFFTFFASTGASAFELYLVFRRKKNAAVHHTTL